MTQYDRPRREQEWTDVPPFTPDKPLSQAARAYVRRCLKGNGEGPETAESILGRTFDEHKPMMLSYLQTIGEL